MASILSSAIITNAQGSVNTYINTANQLYSELQSIINNLTADGDRGHQQHAQHHQGAAARHR